MALDISAISLEKKLSHKEVHIEHSLNVDYTYSENKIWTINRYTKFMNGGHRLKKIAEFTEEWAAKKFYESLDNRSEING